MGLLLRRGLAKWWVTLMSISPRKAEVDAVVTLLTSDDYDTSEAMAKDIIKQVAGDLSKRTTFGVAVGFAGDNHPGLAIGAFYSVRDANKTAKDAREAGMEARVARLSGTGSIRAAQALKQVCVCGHKTEMHVMTTCAVAKCDCQGVDL
jgi:hypothetical protein